MENYISYQYSDPWEQQVSLLSKKIQHEPMTGVVVSGKQRYQANARERDRTQKLVFTKYILDFSLCRVPNNF